MSSTVASERAWMACFRGLVARFRGAFAAGAAAVLALGLLVVTTLLYQENKRLSAALSAGQSQAATQEKERSLLEARLGTLQQQNRGSTERLTRTAAQLQSQMKTQRLQVARLMASETALQQIPLPVPDWQIRVPKNPAIRLIRPVDQAISDTRPTLEVDPVGGDTAYSVRLVRHDSGKEVSQIRQAAPGRWQVTTPLEPGAAYYWTVTTQRGDDPIPLTSSASFSVLSAEDRRTMATAATGKYAREPLALCVLYARMGLWDQTEKQLQSLLKTTPNHPTAKRWLSQLQERRNGIKSL